MGIEEGKNGREKGEVRMGVEKRWMGVRIVYSDGERLVDIAEFMGMPVDF